MRTLPSIRKENIKAVYNGAQGRLWELIMGQQIHIGGLASSLDLANKSNIEPGERGVDLCCCNGAGLRFLIHFRNVKHMTGVDMCEHSLAEAKQRCLDDGLADRVVIVNADAAQTGLPANHYDFVWGEDGWCYVAEKDQLIAEAVRITKPGGVIAFTDWVEGPGPRHLTPGEGTRLMRFMKFPSLATLDDYVALLQNANCHIHMAEHTERLAEHMDLYISMLNKQMTLDALKILDYNMKAMDIMGKEMAFIRQLAHAKKISQALIVAVKKE